MEQDKLSEAIIIPNCQNLDESAFKELVNHWEPRLYYYLRRIIENEDDIWDILQETWLAVFQNIRKLQDPQKFPAWLFQICRNKAVSLLQKENKHTKMINEQMADLYKNNTTISINKEQAELVHKFLGKLKLIHREVLTLYFLQGFLIREIAQIIGISEGTVKSRLYYAKNKLYEALRGMNNA
ncbi:MAG: RNA polymerase sigma factor [Planctomycetota bacterium]